MKCFNFLKITILILCLSGQWVLAQVPQVEKTMDFAGMKLHLTEQARRDIQSSVDALYRSERHFNIMLERVDLYMPLIEPIFEEYGVPDEFKYLVIQESALVPDAISSSNAVGFWQFKETSATELNMRIDRQIDERMNIISATEGAAKYFLRSNAEFDNWLYTLQSYMVGQGGTSRSVDKRHYGAREMKVDDDTHWYVKKFLAYKVAFEPAAGKQKRNLILYQYTKTGNKTLKLIAQEFDTDEEQLISYNKWLKGSSIPDDKTYSVIIPLNIDESEDLLAENDSEKKKKEPEVFGHKQKNPGKIPSASPDKLVIVEFNDLKAIVAREGDNVQKLAETGEISEKRFRRYNDMEFRDKVQAGQIYYLERKHRKARVYEHVYQEGESMWQISQQYGLRLSKLLQKNRLTSASDKIKPGQVLWLRFIRPRSEAVEYRKAKAPRENLYASTKKKLITAPQSAPKNQTEPEAKQDKNENQPTTEQIKKPAVTEKQPEKNTPAAAPEKVTPKQKEPQVKKEVNSLNDSTENTAITEKEAEKKKAITNPEKLLFPAEPTPVTKDINKPAESKEIKVVQKDTVRTQTPEGKVQKESKENSTLTDDWGDQESVFEKAPREPVSKTEATAEVALKKEQNPATPPQGKPEEDATSEQRAKEDEGSFNVDEPVNFVGEKSEKQDKTKEKAATQKEVIHPVKAGETLYALSRQYNVTVQDLIKWNKLPAQPILSVGQELRVSPPEEITQPAAQAQENPEVKKDEPEAIASIEQEKNVKYHTVSAGESMYRVARMYNVTIKDIMQWNNRDNFDLREGEKLIVGKPQD